MTLQGRLPRVSLLAPIIIGLIAFGLGCPSSAEAQQAKSAPGPSAGPSSGPSDHINYYFSLFGGAALGGAAGSVVGGPSAIGKGMLVSGGAISSLYLHYKDSNNFNPPGSGGSRPLDYFISYTALGGGMGWTATDGRKGATVGAIVGFSVAAIRCAFRHRY